MERSLDLGEAVEASAEILSCAMRLGSAVDGAALERLAEGLRSVDPYAIDGDSARIAFWLNLYNARLLQSLHERPRSGHLARHYRLFRTASYRVGDDSFHLDLIEHGLLRGNRRPPYGVRRLLREGDRRLDAAPSQLDPRIHFALNCGARSCPAVRIYSAASVDHELDGATRAYFSAESSVDRDSRTVTLPRLLKYYTADFGSRQDQLGFAAAHLSERDAAFIRAEAGGLRVRYAPYDWRMVS